MRNPYVISFDPDEKLPYGVARFGDIGRPMHQTFVYFATHAEALANVAERGGTVLCDDAAEIAK